MVLLRPNLVQILTALLTVPSLMHQMSWDAQGLAHTPGFTSASASVPPANATESSVDGLLHMTLEENQEEEDQELVHPWVKLQQHINHSKRRFAKMKDLDEPSDEELEQAMQRRQDLVEEELHAQDSPMPEFRPPRMKHMPRGEVLDEAPESIVRARHFGSSAHRPSTDRRSSSGSKMLRGELQARGGYSSTEAKAESQYSVTKAPQVSAPSTAGLAIEANDVGYFVNVKIGTSNTHYKMLVDTGSSDTWITGTNCKCGGPSRNKFGKSSSDSLETSNNHYKISYGTGDVSVQMGTDSFELAGLKLDKFAFGIASSESNDFGASKVPFDGLLGLGGAGLSVTHKDTIIDALKKANKVKAPIVGFRLGRAADGSGKNRGQITFGGVDEKQISGSLTQMENKSNKGYWEVKLDSVSVGGKQVSGSSTAILDTGTSLIIAPQDAADAIHEAIDGAKSDGNGGYTLPCTSKATLSFKFAGKTFKMDSRDLLFAPKDSNNLQGTCVSAVSTGSTMDGAGWLLGAAFLKNVYLATNSDANQIGLGQLN
ncbi:hypothetical protein MCAP1_000673 [Malassezia caprae]|uniref:Peptidase A1 domain-containing protein n=1 Tax=Malassezia caprae TaxID=1381934 RepID=A0AAF0E3Y8_9BASI|nr:hypothetical protein MCAP1_000673 [Malassezia caprae]